MHHIQKAFQKCLKNKMLKLSLTDKFLSAFPKFKNRFDIVFGILKMQNLAAILARFLFDSAIMIVL